MFKNIDFEVEFTPNCYFKMLQAVKDGTISSDEWSYYCEIYLYDLIFLHKDILENLKGGK